MTEIGAGFLVLVLTGVATVAFRYPKGFHQLTVIMMFCGATLSAFLAAWSTAHTLMFATLLGFIPKSQQEAAYTAAAALKVPDWALTFLGALMVAMIFFDWLPKFLKQHEDEGE